MARPLRIELAGAIYHITARGNAQSDIYLNDKDRYRFLELLGETCHRFNWLCHAYCLMTNHYHLVIETGDANLSKGMRHINGVYTQRFNRSHQRVGHIFQGRYKAILIDKDGYLLEAIRYVLLNPVRAHMTKSAGQYRWSSYRAMIGIIQVPGWLAREWILSQFAKRINLAQRRFINFVMEGQMAPGLWENLRNQVYLGDEQFVTRMQATVNDDKLLTEIPRLQRSNFTTSLDDYEQKYPIKIAMRKAYESGGYTFKEIADHFDVHYSTVSRAVNGK
jgi:REP-associated tyrosine transposase